MQQCEKTYETMVQKFKDSAKVWTQYAGFKSRTNDLEGMRHLLPRALKLVPKRKRMDSSR